MKYYVTFLSLSHILLYSILTLVTFCQAIHPVSAQSAGTSEKAPTSSKMAVITTRDNNTHFNINTRQLIHYVIDKFGGCPSEIAIYSWFR